MKKIQVALALVAGAVALSPALPGQNTPKPSPYTGVSQPPPDDTITTDEATPPSKLVTRPAPAVAASPAMTPIPAGAQMVSSSPRAAENPDYGMIGDSQPAAATADVPKPAPVADPDADIVTSVPIRPGELPSGTLLHMALNQEISSQDSQPGTDFSGRVEADVTSAGKVVIPQGSEVIGKVLRVSEGHRFGGPALVRLRPDVVVLPDGSRYVMRAQIVDTDGKSRIDGEGTLTPKSRIKSNAIKEGAGIGTGAVAGALMGGPVGAVVGSAIGAGVMTTHILVQTPAEVRVPKDANLTLSLTEPMMITPAQSAE
jgi:hypothetical protein